MIVLDKTTCKHIGDLNISVLPGARLFRLDKMKGTDGSFWDSFDPKVDQVVETLTVDILQEKYSVRIGEMEIINDRMMCGYGRNLHDLAARRYPQFALFASQPDAEVQQYQTPIDDSICLSVRFSCVKADLDLAEKLFDLDEFTPA